MSYDYTSIQTYRPGSSNLPQNLPGTFAQDYADLAETINKEYENSFSSNGGLSLDDVGVYAQARDKDEDAFIKEMLKGSIAANKLNTKGLLQDAISNPGVAQMLKGLPTGLTLEYIAPDNGDQVRKFGKLIAENAVDNGYKMAITQYALNMYKLAPGNAAKTTIDFAGDYNTPTLLYVPKSQITPLIAGACSCRPSTGSCAYAYRNAYIVKKGDYTPGAILRYEHVWITDVLAGVTNPSTNALDANGGVTLVLKRGTGRMRNEDPLSSAVTPFTQFTPLKLEPGDILVFGQMTPTTECLPDISCVKASPKVYSYCSYSQKFLDCVYEDRPSGAMVQRRDRLSNAQDVAYRLSQTLRDSLHRMSNDILFSLPNYAAGQRRPIDVPNSLPAAVEYNDCDVIPYSNRGIIPTIDLFGNKVEHYFTSANDTCGQYKLGRELEIVAESTGGIADNNMWKLFGDVRPLQRFSAAQGAYANVMPTTLMEAQKMQNMQAATFGNGANSFFGPQFTAMNSNVMDTINFADKAIKTQHDSTLALMFPGTMFLMNFDAFQFFAPDREAITKNRLGFNPYFNATGVRGQLTPLVYTQDLTPTMINGNMEMKSKNNCSLKFIQLMEYGIHVKAKYLPQLTMIKIGSRVPNVNFDPLLPETTANARFVYGSLSQIESGCGSTAEAIDNSLRGWYNPTAIA
jgi:hypothetical protein